MNQDAVYVGVDVSKLTLDFSVLINKEHTHHVIKNEKRCIKSFFKTLDKKHDNRELFVGVENTGRYGWILLNELLDIQCNTYVISPLHLKKSLGLIRGKSDQLDCERIAMFLQKNIDELTPHKYPREVVQELTILLARRNKITLSIRREKATKEEMSHVKKSPSKTFILKESKRALMTLEKQLKRIEKAIESLIKQDQILERKTKLMMSVPGVGKVVSWTMLVKTNEFKNINDPRKLACYCGVAPFEHSSGTSVRGRTRVSVFGDKALKKVLHMAALRVIQLEGELRTYYLRKVAQGKNKMNVINALRNKIIHRIMAVINKNQMYQKNHQNHLIVS